MKRIIELNTSNDRYINNIGFEAAGLGVVNYSQWPVYVRIGALDTPAANSASIIVPPGNSLNIPVSGSNFSFLLDTSTSGITGSGAVEAAYIILYDITEIPPTFGPAPSFNFGETRRSQIVPLSLNSGNGHQQDIYIDTQGARMLNVFVNANGPSAFTCGYITIVFIEIGKQFQIPISRNTASSFFSLPVLCNTIVLAFNGTGIDSSGNVSYALSGGDISGIIFNPDPFSVEYYPHATSDVPSGTTVLKTVNVGHPGYKIVLSSIYVMLGATPSNDDIYVNVVKGTNEVARISSVSGDDVEVILTNVASIRNSEYMQIRYNNPNPESNIPCIIYAEFDYIIEVL
jgi:hypothetical protein